MGIEVAAAAGWLADLQAAICRALESLDGAAAFAEDAWERPGGGGGRTRVLSGGDVFEKAGVNWSHVHGEMRPELAARLPGDGVHFAASGVSLVLHPHRPMVPTVHANIRLVAKGDALWCGGGMDLTPYYPRVEDAVHFHQTLRETCDRHDPRFYGHFKPWCDEYFALPHRGETRGIGGIFFDYLGLDPERVPPGVRDRTPRLFPERVPIEAAWHFTQDVGRAFLSAYAPIVEARRRQPFGETERQFQLVRRGRYVEFNLLYDRGTQFGLQTDGRVESILMSLPPLVRWTYDYSPPAGSREAGLSDFLVPRDWLGLDSPPDPEDTEAVAD